MSRPELVADLKSQLDVDAVAQSHRDPFGFGVMWRDEDSVTYGAGLAIMAMEYDTMTHSSEYANYADRWMANLFGANPWGVSFIVGDGATYPVCPHDQVSNLHASPGGKPLLPVGALVEGPTAEATTGPVERMHPCPSNGEDRYAPFDGERAVYRDNVESYSTNEPAQDLTAPSFLLFAWRLAGASRHATE